MSASESKAPLGYRTALTVAVLALALAWGATLWLGRSEAVSGQDVLVDFPMEMNGWLGRNLEVTERERELLKATGIVMRSYRPPPKAAEKSVEARGGSDHASSDKGNSDKAPTDVTASAHSAALPDNTRAQRLEPALLYIAYYHSQRTGATYHSPQNCMPGAGWQITSLRTLPLTPPGQEQVLINEVLLQKGLQRQLVLYWYHDRGRVVASEYWAKAYMVWDALSQNRSDGALVRISTLVTGSVEEARQHALEFAQAAWPELEKAIPGVALEPNPGAATAPLLGAASTTLPDSIQNPVEP